MAWLRTCLVLLTMTAYALGLPVRLHQAEHERADRDCCACAFLPIFRVSHGLPAAPVKHDSKSGCPVCAELHALIAAGDAPIVLVDARAVPVSIVLQRHVQAPQSAAICLSCRGPPSIA